MIKCHKISLSLSNISLFKELSFEVKIGEKVSICGPSGIGKSSLLRMLMGFIYPQKGTIHINGMCLSPSTITHIRTAIAWLPQNIHLPVNTGLELSHMLNHTPRQREIVPQFMNRLGLSSELLFRDLQEVSGGEKQRIILAACLSMNKPILLLDEPTSALDSESTKLVTDTLWSLPGLTVVTVTHNQQWMECSHKIIRL